MRRSLIAVLVATLVSAAFAQSEDSEWVCPAGFAGQTLNVYNWATYIAEDTIANFEAACDVTVVYDTYASDDDMLVRLRQGNPGFDIVVPSDVIVTLMVDEGLILELDKANIPNWANLDATFLDLPFDPGNLYSAPYQWGTVGIGYNTEKVGEISTWAELFAYDGPVAWLEDTTAFIGVALIMTGHDPNSDSAAAIREASDFLIENGDNVVYIAKDDGQEILVRGEVDMAVEYSGDIFQIMDECECDTYAYVIPEEGTNFWLDNLVIPAGAPNKALAETFIDYVLDPHVGASIANYTAYGSPNLTAIEMELIDPELAEDPGIYPSAETQERLFFATQSAEREQLLFEAWDEIRIFIGR